MKKNYQALEMDVLVMEAIDVLTASGDSLTYVAEVNHEDLDSITIIR